MRTCSRCRTTKPLADFHTGYDWAAPPAVDAALISVSATSATPSTPPPTEEAR